MIDLHTHSTVSDGTLSPAEVVRAAARAGITSLGLTDHDTVAGWDQAVAASRAAGVELVRGIEITCDEGPYSVHLLGLLVDPAYVPLQEELARARDSRLTRMQRMVDKMAADGIPVTYADVQAQAKPGATLGRPHLADALVALGVLPDREAAFAHWLANDGPYYVGHYAPSPVRAVELVVAAGGVAVHAHPLATTRGRRLPVSVIEAMAAAGLSGLEVDHREHPPLVREEGRELAARLGLLVTGGSDFHGTGKPNVLGECTTSPHVYAALVERASGCEVVRP